MHGQLNVKYGEACLRHQNLQNYRTDLFKADVFRRRVIGHRGQPPLFISIPY